MYRDRDFSQEKAAPVKVGEEMEVKIEGAGEKGDGIARKEGFVIFVPNTKKDDKVRIRITRVLRKVGFGEVVGGSGKPAQAASEEDTEPSDAEEGTEDEGTGESNTGDSEAEEDSEPFEDSENFGEEN